MTTVITKTIGPSGRDYASFTLAEADVENIGTSADLVANDEAIVFEADAGTYNESVSFNSTLTTDATRNVTYKPASGSEHGGVAGAGVRIQFGNLAVASNCVSIKEAFIALDGLEIDWTDVNSNGRTVDINLDARGVSISNCLIRYAGTGRAIYHFQTSTYDLASYPVTITNCAVYAPSGDGAIFYNYGASDKAFTVTNCTFTCGTTSGKRAIQAFTYDAGYTTTVTLTNNLVLAGGSYITSTGGSGVVTVLGSNNFGGSTDPFPAALQGSPYPITPTADTYNPGAAGDYALYDSTTGKLIYSVHNDVVDQGVGPSANSDVPTTDIAGNPRSGATANPGAFEGLYVIAPTVITKTIGPSGRDYASFTLAEADTANIGTSADLTNDNEAIVFEADDTTFTTATSLYIANASLTVDATRNISYTAASGRPVYTYTGNGVGVSIYDPYTRWSGIDVVGSSANKAMQVRANSGYGAAQAGTIIENATITAATTAVDCAKHTTSHALGTSSEPITLRNLVTRSRVAVGQFIAGTGHTTGAHCLVVNCTHLGGSSPNQAWNWALIGGMPDASFKIINCANLAQDTTNDANITGGGVDVSGSMNNVGNAAGSNSSYHFANIGGGIGAQYTPTTDTYNPGAAGDYALYDSTTGKLIYSVHNDVVDQGVGPSANSDVPTTDILGNARSGATANPGAFEELYVIDPTVITKTIGLFGRDYLSFTLAEADVENIGTSADLTNDNEAIVFEADAGIYSESVVFQSTLTTDATRNVTYKPAVGSEHGGLSSAGVRLATTGSVLTVRDYFTTLDGLVVDSAASFAIRNIYADGVLIRNCVINAGGDGIKADYSNTGTAVAPFTVENCVVTSAARALYFAALYGSSGPQHFAVRNCTLERTNAPEAILTLNSADTNYGEFTNNLVLGNSAYAAIGSNVITGSNNFGGSTQPFPAALQGSPYPITPTADTYNPGAAGDYALYDSASGKLIYSVHNDVVDQGVGPASNSDVPTTDINGVARSGATSNPGAFEELYVIAPTVITRTIGATGRDYTSFTLAEADVENIGTSSDLVANNEAIVFEADAGTYSESLVVNSTLVTDATRRVTFTCAAGSEHLGEKDAGVILSVPGAVAAITVYDDYVRIDNLNIQALQGSSSNYGIYFANALGCEVDSCSVRSDGNYGIIVTNNSTSSPSTHRIVNSVVIGSAIASNYCFDLRGTTGSGSVSYEVINCAGYGMRDWCRQGFSAAVGTRTNLSLINNLDLGCSRTFQTGGSGTNVTTGSNNFGGSSNLFPVAIQGSPYPITASTAYDPGAGDFALYVGKNGALLDSPNNDVVDQGVGPSVNSDVPLYDILGNPRSGATTNPGAFALAQATAVLTRTIGPVGRDYATFTLAEAAVESIATAETGSTDLVAGNARIEFLADAGTYNESVTIDNSLTCDPTRNVTFQSATYDLAHIETDAFFGVVQIKDGAFTTLRRLQITNTNTGAACRGVEIVPASGDSCEGCTLDGLTVTGANSANFVAFEVELNTNAAAGGAGSAAHPSVLQNCVALGTGTGIGIVGGATGEIHARIVNCTLAGTGLAAISIQTPSDVTVEVVNTINLSHTQTFRTLFTTGALTTSGSNNFGNTTQPFPVALQGSPYPITATTNTTAASTGSQAIYVDETGQLVDVDGNDITDQGIGPASNSDVPTTGITGGTRSGATTLPGAFATLKSLAPAPIIPDAIDYGMPGGYSVASILFENSTTCYLNGVQKTVLYPGQDLSLPLFRSTSADANKDLVIVPNTRPNKQILLHNYSWGHAGLDTTQPLYEPMLSWFTAYGSAVEGDGIALITPRYVGDMDRTTPLEVALPPGKSLALSFVSFPSTPPNTTLVAALTVTYEIVDAGGSSTFTNTYVN